MLLRPASHFLNCRLGPFAALDSQPMRRSAQDFPRQRGRYCWAGKCLDWMPTSETLRVRKQQRHKDSTLAFLSCCSCSSCQACFRCLPLIVPCHESFTPLVSAPLPCLSCKLVSSRALPFESAAQMLLPPLRTQASPSNRVYRTRLCDQPLIGRRCII